MARVSMIARAKTSDSAPGVSSDSRVIRSASSQSPRSSAACDVCSRKLRFHCWSPDALGQREAGRVVLVRVVVDALALEREVEVGAHGRLRLVVLERDPQRAEQQRPRLLAPVREREHPQALGVQGVREHVGQPQGLGDIDRALERSVAPLLVADHPGQPAELGGQVGQVGVARPVGEHGVGVLHLAHRLLGAAEQEEHVAAACAHPGRRPGGAGALVDLERPA